MKGTSSPESLEQSVHNTLSATRPEEGTTEEISDWQPVAHPVLNTLSAAPLEEGSTEQISDWQPVAHPVPKITLDGRLMEGTTCLEHPVLGVSLDSGLMEGTSSPEPLEQSALNTCTLLVAQPMEGYTETNSPERSAPASQLDYGHSNLQKFYLIGSRRHIRFRTLPWTVDLCRGLPKLEHLVLVGSLDSGLTEGMLSLEPLEQLVLNTLLVARPTEGSTETKPLEHSALALQLDYAHLNWESLARPMVDVALDRRPMKGLAVQLPVESLGLAMAISMAPLSVSRPY